MNTNIHLDYEKVREAEFIVSTLHHARRQRILDLLDTYGQMTANHISDEINLDRDTTDDHLNMLRRADLVLTNRQGDDIYYSMNEPKLERVTSAVKRFFG